MQKLDLKTLKSVAGGGGKDYGHGGGYGGHKSSKKS